MSFTTFVHAEFMHQYRESWKTYWQQYKKLATLVAASWSGGGPKRSRASPELITYLREISAKRIEDLSWPIDDVLRMEDAAWKQIWSYVSERINVLETLGRLQQMFPYDMYVHTIVSHIDDYRYEGLEYYQLMKGLEKPLQHKDFILERAIPRNPPRGVYTNEKTGTWGRRPESRLTAIGDLNGDFEATIRCLKRMSIIYIDREKHMSNLDLMKKNHKNQLRKLSDKPDESLDYTALDYTAYNWNYQNNMLVQTGNLFGRGFNSREIIELFMHLDSTSGNGQVVNMAGNHEFMQYYQNSDIFDNIKVDSMSFGQFRNWDENRTKNLAPGSKYFNWIAGLPIIMYETKSKTVLSHGCVVQRWTNVPAINKSVGQIWDNVRTSWGRDGSTRTVFENIDQNSPINCVTSGRDPEALSEDDGPVWNRYYRNAVKQNDKFQDQLKRTVASFERKNMYVDRLICAHTITNMEHMQNGETMGNDCKFKPEQHPVGQTPSVWFNGHWFDGEGKRWGGVELITRGGVELITVPYGITYIVAKPTYC